jgi:hypothetical protein
VFAVRNLEGTFLELRVADLNPLFALCLVIINEIVRETALLPDCNLATALISYLQGT